MYKKAFSIVEIIITIIVLGILSTLAIVSYVAITQNAKISAIKTDLSVGANNIEKYQSQYGSYPTSLGTDNCPTAPVSVTVGSGYCITLSNGNQLASYIGNDNTYALVIQNGSTSYRVTESYPDPVAANVPTAPTNLIASNPTTGKINLSWSAPSSQGASAINGYVIEIIGVGNITTGNTNTNYEWTGGTMGETYNFKVYASNSSGLGPASNTASSVMAGILASGGTESTTTIGGISYKFHRFTSSGTLNIIGNIGTIRVLAVGGGSNGAVGDYASYGGGGGGLVDATITNPTKGNISVTVGGVFSASSFGSYLTANGAPGGNGTPGYGTIGSGASGTIKYGGGGGGDGGGGGNGPASDITGSTTYYSGGGASVQWNYCCPANTPNGGLGGGGAAWCGGQVASYYGAGGGRVQHTCGAGSGPGYQGIVIVRYQQS